MKPPETSAYDANNSTAVENADQLDQPEIFVLDQPEDVVMYEEKQFERSVYLDQNFAPAAANVATVHNSEGETVTVPCQVPDEVEIKVLEPAASVAVTEAGGCGDKVKAGSGSTTAGIENSAALLMEELEEISSWMELPVAVVRAKPKERSSRSPSTPQSVATTVSHVKDGAGKYSSALTPSVIEVPPSDSLKETKDEPFSPIKPTTKGEDEAKIQAIKADLEFMKELLNRVVEKALTEAFDRSVKRKEKVKAEMDDNATIKTKKNLFTNRVQVIRESKSEDALTRKASLDMLKVEVKALTLSLMDKRSRSAPNLRTSSVNSESLHHSPQVGPSRAETIKEEPSSPITVDDDEGDLDENDEEEIQRFVVDTVKDISVQSPVVVYADNIRDEITPKKTNEKKKEHAPTKEKKKKSKANSDSKEAIQRQRGNKKSLTSSNDNKRSSSSSTKVSKPSSARGGPKASASVEPPVARERKKRQPKAEGSSSTKKRRSSPIEKKEEKSEKEEEEEIRYNLRGSAKKEQPKSNVKERRTPRKQSAVTPIKRNLNADLNNNKDINTQERAERKRKASVDQTPPGTRSSSVSGPSSKGRDSEKKKKKEEESKKAADDSVPRYGLRKTKKVQYRDMLSPNRDRGSALVSAAATPQKILKKARKSRGSNKSSDATTVNKKAKVENAVKNLSESNLNSETKKTTTMIKDNRRTVSEAKEKSTDWTVMVCRSISISEDTTEQKKSSDEKASENTAPSHPSNKEPSGDKEPCQNLTTALERVLSSTSPYTSNDTKIEINDKNEEEDGKKEKGGNDGGSDPVKESPPLVRQHDFFQHRSATSSSSSASSSGGATSDASPPTSTEAAATAEEGGSKQVELSSNIGKLALLSTDEEYV